MKVLLLLSPSAASSSATMIVLPLLLLLFTSCAVVQAKNMNGNPGDYRISNLQGQYYNTDYNDDDTVEYFDLYTPLIRTLYSEVYWKEMDTVSLPEEIIRRFQNRTMAIVGYEVDQVRKKKTYLDDDEDKSIPITYAYNHHYYAWMINSKKAKHVQKMATDEMIRQGRTHHGSNVYYETEYFHEKEDERRRQKSIQSSSQQHDDDDDDKKIPFVQILSEGNGGEFRLSYHGYPKGYAQLIHSPNEFHVVPMQIDTWNRDAGQSAKFKPGAPLPKSSRIPDSAGYSGLIECPCSTRLPKTSHMTYKLLQQKDDDSSSCAGTPVQNATECWSAARDLVSAAKVQMHDGGGSSTDGKPLGCSLEQHQDGSMDVYWRPHNDKLETKDELRVEDASSPHQVVAFASGQINASVALSLTGASITLVGPADRWFGIGFGTDSMCLHMEADECTGGGPYAILVSEDLITERKLEYHGPGVELPPSVTVLSDTVQGENRTVVLTRPLQGPTPDYFDFDPHQQKAVPIITARGCSLTFAQHCGHGPAQLNFVAMDQATRVCQNGIKDYLGGKPFSNDRCGKAPLSDLLTQKNPTCFFEDYRGGLECCRHGHYLLDQEQDIPWDSQYLEYHLKFRFYFEEYKPAAVEQDKSEPEESVAPSEPSHKELHRLYRQTEFHAGEYDIVQCPDETPRSQCIQVITAQWKVPDMLWGESIDMSAVDGLEIIYAGPHCHAPSCISMELFNADTGQLLCHMEPVFGQSDEDVMKERNFLSLPPCLWGSEDGLAKPVLLPVNATLLSIKRNNNTLPHTGEMASWQMRGHVVYKSKDDAASDLAIDDRFEAQVKTSVLRRRRREDQEGV